MRVANLFHKANDDLPEDVKYQDIVNETLNNEVLSPPNYVTEDLSKFHFAITSNPPSTWRATQRQSTFNKLTEGLKTNSLAIWSSRRKYYIGLTEIRNEQARKEGNSEKCKVT